MALNSSLRARRVDRRRGRCLAGDFRRDVLRSESYTTNRSIGATPDIDKTWRRYY